MENKTVIITGSGRGFGLEMLKIFRKNGFNVVVCDVNEDTLTTAKNQLEKIEGDSKILTYCVDITKEVEVTKMIDETLKMVPTIDIWINNAGVNQAPNTVWELDSNIMNRLIDIDLKGTILCSKIIMNYLVKQGFGQIFNVEGFGSNDAYSVGLSIYGTAKRAVTYFTEALAYEVEKKNLNICVGKITPGIMITNFITHPLGDGKAFELDAKTKKVYNILGDYPETIATYIVPRVIKNQKNKAKIAWLTNRKAFWRFMTCGFNKKDFFSEKN